MKTMLAPTIQDELNHALSMAVDRTADIRRLRDERDAALSANANLERVNAGLLARVKELEAKRSFWGIF